MKLSNRLFDLLKSKPEVFQSLVDGVNIADFFHFFETSSCEGGILEFTNVWVSVPLFSEHADYMLSSEGISPRFASNTASFPTPEIIRLSLKEYLELVILKTRCLGENSAVYALKNLDQFQRE